MADTLELVPTLPDVGRQPEIAMAAYKPEVVITQEQYEISARFQEILDIFDHTQHSGSTTVSLTLSDVGRHSADNRK